MAILRAKREAVAEAGAALMADKHLREIHVLTVNGRQPIPDGRRRTILVNGWWSLSALTNREGKGTREDWDTLADCMNQARMLSLRGFGPEHAEILDAALAGIIRSEQRAAGVGRWGLDGDAKYAITHALLVFEVQLESIVQGDLAQALILIGRHLREGSYQQ